MLCRIGDELTLVRSELAECERRAADPAADPAVRASYKRLCRTWQRLADSYDLAARISGYLEWQAQRLQPPPEFLAEE